MTSVTQNEPKTSLLVPIVQSFGNGIVANGTVEALNRMLPRLEQL